MIVDMNTIAMVAIAQLAATVVYLVVRLVGAIMGRG